VPRADRACLGLYCHVSDFNVLSLTLLAQNSVIVGSLRFWSFLPKPSCFPRTQGSAPRFPLLAAALAIEIVRGLAIGEAFRVLKASELDRHAACIVSS
jgi:hypothetical protein